VTTCLPAAMAASTCALCRCVGVATKMTSALSLAARASTLAKVLASGKSWRNRSSAVASVSAAAASTKAGFLRTGRIIAVPALPRPAMAKRKGVRRLLPVTDGCRASALGIGPFVISLLIRFRRHQAFQTALRKSGLEFFANERLFVRIFDLV